MSFRAVLLDYRGTLVPAPTYAGLVARGLARIGRPSALHDVESVLRRLRAGDRSGGSLADLVDVWALSYEVGAAKPDHRIFEAALDGWASRPPTS